MCKRPSSPFFHGNCPCHYSRFSKNCSLFKFQKILYKGTNISHSITQTTIPLPFPKPQNQLSAHSSIQPKTSKISSKDRWESEKGRKDLAQMMFTKTHARPQGESSESAIENVSASNLEKPNPSFHESEENVEGMDKNVDSEETMSDDMGDTEGVRSGPGSQPGSDSSDSVGRGKRKIGEEPGSELGSPVGSVVDKYAIVVYSSVLASEPSSQAGSVPPNVDEEEDDDEHLIFRVKRRTKGKIAKSPSSTESSDKSWENTLLNEPMTTAARPKTRSARKKMEDEIARKLPKSSRKEPGSQNQEPGSSPINLEDSEPDDLMEKSSSKIPAKKRKSGMEKKKASASSVSLKEQKGKKGAMKKAAIGKEKVDQEREDRFKKAGCVKGKILIDVEETDLATLLKKLKFQGWDKLFQKKERKYLRDEVQEFYINFSHTDTEINSFVKGSEIVITKELLAAALGVPAEGYCEYVRKEWPSRPDQVSSEEVLKKYFSNHTVSTFEDLQKKLMGPYHQLLFEFLLKNLLPRSERRSRANFLDLTYMDLLDKRIHISLAGLMMSHLKRVATIGTHGHAMVYGCLLTDIFIRYGIIVSHGKRPGKDDWFGRNILKSCNYVVGDPTGKEEDESDESDHELDGLRKQVEIQATELRSLIAENIQLKKDLAQEKENNSQKLSEHSKLLSEHSKQLSALTNHFHLTT